MKRCTGNWRELIGGGVSLLLAALGSAQDQPAAAPAPAAPVAAPSDGPTLIEVPIQQVTRLHNSQSNVLEGVGLVVGLNGTGSGDVATRMALRNLIQGNGNNVRDADLVGGAAALVHLRATLPPFSREGMLLDVTVSCTGDATSLFGGMLVQTELRGIDGTVFALASGRVVNGGFAAGGKQAKVTRNHPTVGVVPKGASVVRELKSYYLSEAGHLELQLINPHESTAKNIATAIQKELSGLQCKVSVHGSTLVRIELPSPLRTETAAVDVLTRIGDLKVRVHNPATVVIDEATGMVLAGEGVMISPCTVTLEDLTISVVQQDEVVQPLPGINGGVTEVVGRTQIDVATRKSDLKPVRGGTTVNELLENLKALELEPRQLITVFQKLADNGYLQAKLVVN